MSAFPRGLIQPESSGRFGLDALLLASWGAKAAEKYYHDNLRIVIETGCGCGAALLGFALLHKNSSCIGLELEKELAEAACQNAIQLNLPDKCLFYQADLANLPKNLQCYREKAQLVLANPPWRKPGDGLITNKSLAKNAHWELTGTLELFLESAAYFLEHHGRLCLIIPIWQLHRLMAHLVKIPLGLREIQPIASWPDGNISRLLIICQKNSAMDYKMAFPLAIHEKRNNKIGYSQQARDFCPWLQ